VETTDDLEAAWGAVHDATVAGALMSAWRVRLVVAIMVTSIFAVGCVPRPPLPADILRALDAQGMTFQASDPIAGSMSAAAALERIRANHSRPFANLEPLGQPIFGIASCVDSSRCNPGPPIGVWVLRFPGQQPGMAPDDSIVVNAATGDTLFSVRR
jgi:hypothetical protein